MNDILNLTFPGDEIISTSLAAAIRIGFEISVFVLILHVIHFYIPGKTNVTRMLGRAIGILVGIFAAKVYTLTFTQFFQLPPLLTSGVLFLFIATNAGFTCLVYSSFMGAYNGNSSSKP
jgi:hypothetical protein